MNRLIRSLSQPQWLLFAGLLLGTVAAQAQVQPGERHRESGREKVGVYSFAEISYQRLSQETAGGDRRSANGLAVAGSWEVLQHTYVFADYQLFRDTGRSNALDQQQGRIGTGLAFPVARPLDLFVEGSLLHSRTERCVDSDCDSINSGGYGLGAGAWIALNPAGGLRISWTERRFEREAPGNPVQTSDRLIEVGLHTRQSGHSIVLGGQAYSDANSFRVGYRYTF